ncbi:MAG: hypothetical protein Q7T57_04140, partial [Dehalococcoidales bacterium]|nr:hypothetical protein [Dehalococcoidales bacterium]
MSSNKKQWYSYDESDLDTQYAFQRKKRCGTKNGSDAVKNCLQWSLPVTARNGLLGSEEDSDEEGYSRVPIQKEPTPKVGQQRTCQCSNAFEMLQLKQAIAQQQNALQRNEATTQQLLKKQAQLANHSKQQRTHTCGCGCATTVPFGSQSEGRASTAWQQIPLAQVLDGQQGQARDLRSPSPQPAPGRQNESVQTVQLATASVGTSAVTA